MDRLRGPKKEFSKTPMYVLLAINALISILLIYLVIASWSGKIFMHFWAYPALLSAFVLALLGIASLGIYHRISNEKIRKYVAILLIMVLSVVGVVGYSIAVASNEALVRTMGVFTSPNGRNRLIVTRGMVDEDNYVYIAYPMADPLFYRVSMDDVALKAGKGSYQVEWIDDDHARVFLPEPLDEAEPNSADIYFSHDS